MTECFSLKIMIITLAAPIHYYTERTKAIRQENENKDIQIGEKK